jgi:hypothetical protein
VGRRSLFAALLAAALVADAAGSHSLAFWALVGAVPAAAACALASFGAFLERADDAVGSLQALLWAPALLLLLVAAAARGPAIAAAGVPRLGESALVGCLAVLALKLLVYAGAELHLRLTRGSTAAAAARS